MNISIYGREAIEKLLCEGFPENTAVISFYDPPYRTGIRNPPVEYDGKVGPYFYMELDDIDANILGDYGFTYETYLPDEETAELAEFIYSAKAEGMSIICQCEYGQSRSAGCAAAIREHFHGDGIEIFADYRYYPNQLVYHKVYDALERYKSVSGEPSRNT